ncbi:thymocyte nuclear protein 1-like isoform X2 [Mercenaria mercenaria]|uniref:thymocyte nuclear protein 1-like isoform X2 n=1 Tax=Mercenaria mercenaria TaxID=6596 RepID=UPI00234EBC53|nr:thymocyte nuclear protein 1-like isoform X2 [Mercenaria mercenaria]
MPKKRKRESTVTRSQLKEEQDGGDVKSARKILKPKSKLDSSTVQYTHWLMKSEPESRFENGVDVKFGIEDLKVCPNQTACWDGVRNYQVVKESYVDHTQFDSKDPHFDSSSKKDNPKWFMVDVQFKRMMKRYIRLSELKALHLKHKESGGPLKNVALFTKARLSVQPLTQEEWDFILSLEDKE